jgi:hypothetical protein
MNDSLENLLSRHRGGSILIDTNILLLLFVGAFDRKLIPVFKRTATFLPEDFDLLLRLIGMIPKIVTTPHVLAEVNSLSGQLGEPKRTEYFARFVTQVGLLDERYVASASAAAHAAFPRIGLTDAGILSLAGKKLLVLTDDFRFSSFLAAANADHINFNHIRSMVW